jgi:hypothetical protein
MTTRSAQNTTGGEDREEDHRAVDDGRDGAAPEILH